MQGNRIVEEIRNTWDRMARSYKEYRDQGCTDNQTIEVPAMLALIGKVNGLRILDIGCGFGYYSVHCAKHGAEVVGIDLSKEMIQLARKNALAG